MANTDTDDTGSLLEPPRIHGFCNSNTPSGRERSAEIIGGVARTRNTTSNIPQYNGNSFQYVLKAKIVLHVHTCTLASLQSTDDEPSIESAVLRNDVLPVGSYTRQWIRCTGFPPVDSQCASESYRVAGPPVALCTRSNVTLKSV